MANISNAQSSLNYRWPKLLAWLRTKGMKTGADDLLVECKETPTAGNGLFARISCTPSSLLFAVPPQALMNIRTLKSLYPTSRPTPLTAVQMISLHLYINRPHGGEDSPDPHYGPYISTLPREFDSHPLTWIVRSKSGMESGGAPLLGYLPPSVHASLVKLHDRFCQDWAAIRAYLTANSYICSKYDAYLDNIDNSISNYVWAWLNVNTRCIYYRLKASKEDPDNLTLCPILDFANHTSNGLHMTPAPSEADIWDSAPVNLIGKGFRFLSPADVSVQEGKEIFLAYGAHPNRTLFVEYGFVNKSLGEVGITDGEVDVQNVVESLILDHKSGVFVQSVLEDEGYWGDWTLYCSAESAQPSWRLITALRLHCLFVSNNTIHHNAIQPWRDVIAGKREMISDGNELAWKESLITICNTIITKAQASLKSDGTEDCGHGWLPWMRENIRTLWREELLVAAAVKQRTLSGDNF
ncbi:SET domain-containing protein [Suillus weaverae]|nr:SET domain-containing protein [Suillus weaverae]